MDKELQKARAEIKQLQKQINCVKPHPEMKPQLCCWTADSLMMQEYEKDNKRLYKKLEGMSDELDEAKRRAKQLRKDKKALLRMYKIPSSIEVETAETKERKVPKTTSRSRAGELVEKCLDELYNNSEPPTTWKAIKSDKRNKIEYIEKHPKAKRFYERHMITVAKYDGIVARYRKLLGIWARGLSWELLCYAPKFKDPENVQR